MKSALRTTAIVYLILAAVAVALGLAVPAWFRTLREMLSGAGDFAFAYPLVLFVALLILPVVLLILSRPKRRQVATMAFTRGDLLVGGPRTWRALLAPVPPILRALGLLALCLALARPQVAREHTIEAEGIDIYVILDMSGSMQAVDMDRFEVRQLEMQGRLPPNRFDIARDVLSEFVERRKENDWYDRVGMVIFARFAFLQFPLTIDYDTVLWLIDRLELNVIDASQTAIGNALGRAVLGLIDSETTSRIVVLITDGDERGGNLSALEAARVAGDEGIQIYPVLVGREGTVLVPSGRADFNFRRQYVEREYPVDPELLQEVADLTGGRFFRAQNRESLETTLEEIIAEYEKTAHESSVDRQRDDVFFPFVLAGFAFVGLELLLAFGLLRKFP